MSILTLFLRKKMFATTRTIVLLCSKFCLTIDYFSFRYPFIGASPDGMLPDCVVEIKCPWILRHSKPDDFSKLNKSQVASFCSEKTANGLVLKKSHNYYAQIQLQMWVTGMKYGIFCI